MEGGESIGADLSAPGKPADHQEPGDLASDGRICLSDLHGQRERGPVPDGVHRGNRVLFWDPGREAVRRENLNGEKCT